MKKLLPIFIIACSIFATSCTREYICQCVVSYSGVQPGLPDTTIFEFKIKDKKKTAISNCEANSTNYVSPDNIVMTEKCRIY